jgi:hypothetical protein
MTPPYAHIPEEVVDAWPKLSPSAKALAVALAAHMDKAGQCWPSVPVLRERSGLRKPQTIADAVAELETAGLVTVGWRARRRRVIAWAKVPLRGTIENAAARQNRNSESALARTPKVPLRGTGNNTKNTKDSASPSEKQFNAWAVWVEEWRKAGLTPDPTATGPATKTAKLIGQAIKDEAELRQVFARYLACRERFFEGHPLTKLYGNLDKFRQNGHPAQIKGDSADKFKGIAMEVVTA